MTEPITVAGVAHVADERARVVVVGRAEDQHDSGCPGMEKDYLILKRSSASRPSGEWNEDDYDVLAEGVVVGHIMKVHAAPVGSPWMWTFAFGQREDRTPRHGCAATREAAMAAFAKIWRRE